VELQGDEKPRSRDSGIECDLRVPCSRTCEFDSALLGPVRLSRGRGRAGPSMRHKVTPVASRLTKHPLLRKRWVECAPASRTYRSKGTASTCWRDDPHRGQRSSRRTRSSSKTRSPHTGHRFCPGSNGSSRSASSRAGSLVPGTDWSDPLPRSRPCREVWARSERCVVAAPSTSRAPTSSAAAQSKIRPRPISSASVPPLKRNPSAGVTWLRTASPARKQHKTAREYSERASPVRMRNSGIPLSHRGFRTPARCLSHHHPRHCRIIR
jgi:hypothetical protein